MGFKLRPLHQLSLVSTNLVTLTGLSSFSLQFIKTIPTFFRNFKNIKTILFLLFFENDILLSFPSILFLVQLFIS